MDEKTDELTAGGRIIAREIGRSVKAIESDRTTRDIFSTREYPTDQQAEQLEPVDRAAAEAIVTRRVLRAVHGTNEHRPDRQDTVLDERYFATTLQDASLLDGLENSTRRFDGALTPVGVTQPDVEVPEGLARHTSKSPTAASTHRFGERYRVLAPMKTGSQGNTYLGRRNADGEYVVIKEMQLAKAVDWKSMEQFERQIAVLRAVKHPGIPSFIDAFGLDEGDEHRFILVQEFISGATASSELLLYGPWAPQRLMRLAESVLSVVDYLHRCRPVVLHRDIKPDNIVRRGTGSFNLVDFGVVSLLRDEAAAETVVGSPGYGAPEQFMGRSIPASDLYGLGATLVHLATGVPPFEMKTDRQRLRWRHLLVGEFPTGLVGFIDKLVEPMPEDRFASAAAALSALGDIMNARDEPESAILAKSATSDVVAEVTDSGLLIAVPDRFSVGRIQVSASLLFFGLFLMLFFSNPVWIVSAAVLFIVGVLVGITANSGAKLEMSSDGWSFEERLWRFPIRSRGIEVKRAERLASTFGGSSERIRIYTEGENLEISGSITREEADRIERAISTYISR